jgi:hypothetical protein
MGGVGLSNPMSDLRDVADVGWHAMAGMQLSVASLPVGLRADGTYHSFGDKAPFLSTNLLSGALSLVVTLPGVGLSPYILGGLGVYRTSFDGSSNTQSDSGFHGAFGVDIGSLGFGGFAEVRLVNVSTDPGNRRFVTATLGFRL